MSVVLIIDDNFQNRYLLDVLMKGHGLETLVAENGLDALEKLRNAPVDLIICDILMPVMDGFEFCRVCKSHDVWKKIPFIFYTSTYTALKDERFALNIGADRFLLKPQPPDALLSVVREMLQGNAVSHSTVAGQALSESPLGPEMEFFREHNVVLFKKLEDKMVELEHEIEERRQVEAALRESEANLKAAERVAHFGNWGLQVESLDSLIDTPMRWSDEVFRILGHEPGSFAPTFGDYLVGLPSDDHPTLIEAIQHALHGVERVFLEHNLVDLSGITRVVRGSVECVSTSVGPGRKLLGTIQDITEQRSLEADLRQSQKMESFGQLVGGITHDFNNILSAILLNAGLLKTSQELKKDSLDVVEQITEAATRASNLTRQLLTFCRKQPIKQKSFDLNLSLHGLMAMLRRIIGGNITLEGEISLEPLPVYGDPGMLEQVVVNLVLNARDAMPQGGRIAIRSEKASESMIRPEKRGRDFLVLRVDDDGCGIPKENLSRIFDPFFTTKEVGKGTGLGLATAQSIIQQHGGWMEVESKAGEGSCFRVFLPLLSGVFLDEQDRVVCQELAGGREGILVVEDDLSIRFAMCRFLRRLGYQVFEATDCVEALTGWAKDRDQVDLIITDMALPGGLTGWQLYGQLLLEKPALKVLYISGFFNDVVSGLVLTEGVNYLHKPFSPETLAGVIRRCLSL